MPNRLGWAIIAAVLVALVGGNALYAWLNGRTGDSGEGVIVPRYAAGSSIGSDDVLVPGVLYRDGRCLYYRTSTPSEEYPTGLLVLPEGEGTWDDQRNALTFDGFEYEVGDRLFAASPAGRQWEWAVEPHSSCETALFWVGEPGAFRPPGAGEPP